MISAERMIAISSKYVLHPFSTVGCPPQGNVIFTQGKGAKVWDMNGKEYLDFGSQLSACTIGHGREEMAESISSQALRFGFCHIFWGTAHTAVIEYAHKLADVTPEGLNHFLFVSGGSMANDSAIKLARAYWQAQGRTTKNKVISLSLSYHGITLAMTSCTALDKVHAGFGPLDPNFVHIPTPNCYHCPLDLSYPSCVIKCAEALVEVINCESEDNVGAFIGEPVLGGGGYIVPPPEYYPRIREICADHNILFIADEVITGFGRTGKFWGHQHWNILPDIMVMAKGITGGYMPFGAVAVNEGIYQGLLNHPLAHGETFSGHPVSCAAATKFLEILMREKLVERAAEMGRYLQKRLAELTELPYVSNQRGLGLMCAVDLIADKATKVGFFPKKDPAGLIKERAFEEGLLIRSIGDSLTFSPPYIVTTGQIDWAIGTLKRLLLDLKID